MGYVEGDIETSWNSFQRPKLEQYGIENKQSSIRLKFKI